MKQLYIDFDGVMLDTLTSPYAFLEKHGMDTSNFEQVSAFFTELDWKAFIKKVPVIHNSFECIERIIDSGKFEVSILTHVNTLEEATEKVKYIRKYLTDITIIPVPRKISKTEMVHANGAILIDDYTGNLKEWEEAGGIGVRFSTKLSSKGYPVIDYLDQILEMDFLFDKV